jgi:uncharacterized protein YbjT (DUF2867 family)
MKVVVFGATGMIGHGVVKECLAHPAVDRVLTVGRRECPESDEKLTQIVHDDFLDLSPIEEQLRDCDACFFCLGVSSGGMKPEAYRRITVDFTRAAAASLSRANPGMVMCFVSGAGTSAKSRQRWARVKAEAEESLQDFTFKAVHCFRPGFIQPMKGVTSTIGSYRALYAVVGPLYPLLKRARGVVTSTPEVGIAMINAVRLGAAPVLENRDICELAARAS